MPMKTNKKLPSLARCCALVAVITIWSVANAQEAEPAKADRAAKRAATGQQWQRKTIYHSPQTPGYTCWVGAWQMPDKTLMVHFKQATGPLVDRPHASADLLARLDRIGDALKKDPQRDFTGLKLANVYL